MIKEHLNNSVLDDNTDVIQLLNDFGVDSINPFIYEVAFIHPTYSNERGLDIDNQRLEFVGDAVAGLVFAEYLFEKFQGDEGVLSKNRQMLISKEGFSYLSQKLGLNTLIKFGKGEILTNGHLKPSNMCDVFEAFFGAMFRDKGFEYTREKMYEIVIPIIEEEWDDIVADRIDYKTVLQEHVQQKESIITYELISKYGPSHDMTFETRVLVDGLEFGKAKAGSKKKSEKLAAKDALNKLVF